MSAKKGIESTKVPVEESNDSGYLSNEVLSSGPISEGIRPTQEVSGPQSSTLSDHHSTTLSSLQKNELDSGIVDFVSGEISSEITQTEDKVFIDLRDHLDKCQIQAPLTEVSPTPISECSLPLAKVFQQDADGDTVVHVTAVHGCKIRTALLIRLCPHPSWLDITNDQGHTALHLAVKCGHAVIARMLLKAGASIAIRDHMGETALHIAVTSGKRDCLLALLDPLEPNRKNVRDAVLNQTNYHGQACVHIAARTGNVEMLQTLVLYGADINVKDGSAGWTPLHVAASAGCEPVARYLLERGHVNRYARDYAGRTPLRLSRRTPVQHFFLHKYNHEDDETDSDTDDDGEDFLEMHTPRAVAVSS